MSQPSLRDQRIIAWSTDPRAFAAGCLLEELGSGVMIPPSSEETLPLFTPRERPLIPDELSALLKRARSRLLLHPSWNSYRNHPRFWRMLLYALRWRGGDTESVLHSLKICVRQSFRYGLPWVEAQGSPESQRAFKAGREAGHEIHRAYGFTRLIPVQQTQENNDKMLIGRCESPHAIGDFVAPYFAHRNPGWDVLIIFKEQRTAWGARQVHNEGSVHVWREEAEPYLVFLEDHSFDDSWRTFYDSQYIPGRRNRRLAQKCLPKKYWDWVPEGRRIENPDGDW